jgi:Homeodomain-like domain
MIWARMLAYITGTVDQELLLRNEYLAAENRILRAKIKGRLLLSDSEKATLAEIAHRLGRKALKDVAAAAKPDTLYRWYRELIAKKFDGSTFRKSWGRPRIAEEIERLVVRMARENLSWGYDRIVGAMANLGYKLSDETVGNILRRHDIPPAPKRKQTTSWKDFIRAHMAVMVGTDFFAAEVLKTLALPARSPNLNAYAERWVRSVKEECLAKLILFGEGSLRRALRHYEVHYHQERNHQGKGNLLLFPSPTRPASRKQGKVRCRERLGGLLKYYKREAA